MIRAYARLSVALALLLAVALPGYYNRRDNYSHWVRKDQPTGRLCGHACCRNLRAHPESYPVAKRSKYLRHATDQQVADWYGAAKDDRGRDQALGEMQRRDVAQERKEAAEEKRRQRWANRQQFRRSERERMFTEAETATTGYMLNRRGREAGINPRSLMTGPESRVRKYGSEELLNSVGYHPRPTEAYFSGQDSRIGYGQVLAPRRRMTTEEQDWRDRFDRVTWPIETEAA
jgi:hypothetical protein